MNRIWNRKQTSPITACGVLLFLLWSGTCAQVSDEKIDATKTGAINGRVVNENGQPLNQATIFIRAFGIAGPGRTTSTDSDGNFRVDGLDPATYLVSAMLPAYVTAARDPDSTQPTYYKIGDSVRLELIKGGVITGAVTTASGAPVVAVLVKAQMIRDVRNQPARYTSPIRTQATDDRGIYRLYGLAPGTYVVSAGGPAEFSGYDRNGFDRDVPTFAPSSTRDTATQITLHPGEEIGGVDISYRGEPGHTVSGNVVGFDNAPGTLTIYLSAVFNGESQPIGTIYQPSARKGYLFPGVADGEYDLTARSFGPQSDSLLSEHRRIKVKGSDVTGIDLVMKPLASIKGHTTLQQSTAAECKGKRRPAFAEIVIAAWHNEKTVAKDQPQFAWAFGGPTMPDKEGDFTLRNLVPGQYRFNVRTLAKYWYLQSIALPASGDRGAKSAQAGRTTDAAKNWTTVKTADRISGLSITLAEGAASLRGNIKMAEGQTTAPRAFVYLVPAEQEQTEDILRFFASQISPDGTFALNNLPPGRYWVMAQTTAETESNIFSRLRLPDESEMRAKLLREARGLKTEAVLKPCQNVADFQLSLEAAK